MAIKIRSSRNPDVMDKNIQRLADGLNDLDVEIPEHTVSDAGKYLGVDSSGDLEFSSPLPATTGASTGDVLGLTGEDKVPGWITPYTPPAYSSTEEVNTGQKWIDGKDIYCKVFTGTYLESESATAKTLLSSVDTIVYSVGMFGAYAVNSYRSANSYNLIMKTEQGAGVLFAVTTADRDYKIGIYYTKPDPEPEPGPENEIREAEEPVTKARKKSTK